MMGGNTAYYDSVHQNMNNAASMSKLKFVNYSIGVDLKNTSYLSESNNESSTAAAINYISVAIPTNLNCFFDFLINLIIFFSFNKNFF